MSSSFFLGASSVILVAVLLSLYRVVRGPSIIDRIIGVNVIGTKTIAVIVLTGISSTAWSSSSTSRYCTP